MQHTTRWKPDTCGCVIDYTWDDTDQREARALMPVAVTTCAAHAGLSVLDAWSAVRDENTRKNKAVAAAAEAAGVEADTIAWRITPERGVVIEAPKRN